MNQKIAVLDFGSQYTQVIARRIRAVSYTHLGQDELPRLQKEHGIRGSSRHAGRRQNCHEPRHEGGCGKCQGPGNGARFGDSLASGARLLRDGDSRCLSLIHISATSDEDFFAAQRKLCKLPRNASKIRIRNRCSITGRSRGYVGKFGVSRITFRELALDGKLPGVTKSSW